MNKLMPKDCVNSKCKNVIYLPVHKFHQIDVCETCQDAKE